MSPPTLDQFKKVFTQDLVQFYQWARKTYSTPGSLLQLVFSINREFLLKSGAVVIQLAGLFSLGEIVGRRHIYGYKRMSQY